MSELVLSFDGSSNKVGGICQCQVQLRAPLRLPDLASAGDTLSNTVSRGRGRVKGCNASRGLFLPVFSSTTKNQVCKVMWNGTSAMLQSHWNPPRGSQLVTGGPGCCAARSPWLRDGGDAGRLCGFSTRRVVFRRFDTISGVELRFDHALCAASGGGGSVSVSLTRDASQVINGINPVMYYCWLACLLLQITPPCTVVSIKASDTCWFLK